MTANRKTTKALADDLDGYIAHLGQEVAFDRFMISLGLRPPHAPVEVVTANLNASLAQRPAKTRRRAKQ